MAPNVCQSSDGLQLGWQRVGVPRLTADSLELTLPGQEGLAPDPGPQLDSQSPDHKGSPQEPPCPGWVTQSCLPGLGCE